jgi:hypothetical protein
MFFNSVQTFAMKPGFEDKLRPKHSITKQMQENLSRVNARPRFTAVRPRTEEIQNENVGRVRWPRDLWITALASEKSDLFARSKLKGPQIAGACTENSAAKHIGNVTLGAERHVIDLTRHEGINHIFVFRPVAHF